MRKSCGGKTGRCTPVFGLFTIFVSRTLLMMVSLPITLHCLLEMMGTDELARLSTVWCRFFCNVFIYLSGRLKCCVRVIYYPPKPRKPSLLFISSSLPSRFSLLTTYTDVFLTYVCLFPFSSSYYFTVHFFFMGCTSKINQFQG